jgi:hypothetical protein
VWERDIKKIKEKGKGGKGGGGKSPMMRPHDEVAGAD